MLRRIKIIIKNGNTGGRLRGLYCIYTVSNAEAEGKKIKQRNYIKLLGVQQ